MGYYEKSLTFLISVVLIGALTFMSVPMTGADSPQGAFAVAFADTLEEGLDKFGISEHLEEPLRDEIMAVLPYRVKLEEFLVEEFGFDEGVAPQNLLRTARLFPGFNEVEELLGEEVLMDILSMPLVSIAVLAAIEHAFPELEPAALFALVDLATLFGGAALIEGMIGESLPAIELFAALDYLLGEGFAQNLLEMDLTERFAYLGHALAQLIVDTAAEYEEYIFEALEKLEERIS
ncbi:MAG: hypothetical protein LBE35_11260 [Clostridiales bacterium]|jgi:hypothetical protein|nr:hypothetical protein [Clostridiales bacterium]